MNYLIDQRQRAIIITKKMYYNDTLKREVGFYPQIAIAGDVFNCSMLISFALYKHDDKQLGWRQLNKDVIYGFTYQNGIELLKSLNIEVGVNASIIINSGSRIIYPITHNTTFYILENYSKIREPENLFVLPPPLSHSPKLTNRPNTTEKKMPTNTNTNKNPEEEYVRILYK